MWEVDWNIDVETACGNFTLGFYAGGGNWGNSRVQTISTGRTTGNETSVMYFYVQEMVRDGTISNPFPLGESLSRMHEKHLIIS